MEQRYHHFGANSCLHAQARRGVVLYCTYCVSHMKCTKWIFCWVDHICPSIHITVFQLQILLLYAHGYTVFRCRVFNPSEWSDEHCSSQRKLFLQWSDEQCSSCCMLSFICLYLDNIGSKCNRATSCLFMKELALLWCGRQFLEIIYSFFLCSRNLGFLFEVCNLTDDFMRSSNSEMKKETTVIAILT